MNATDYDDDGFVYIPKWIYRLDLTLAETTAYGIIYAFSQEQQGCYFGSLEYLARYCRVSRRHAMRVLQNLEDAGLIIRESHPGSTTHFYAVDKKKVAKLYPCQNVTGDNMSPHPCNNVTPTRDTMSPNNKEDNKSIIKTHSSTRTREDGKVLFGEFVRLTPDEHDKLVAEYGADDTARMIEILDVWLADQKKDPYKSHYIAIKKWCYRALQEQKTAELERQTAEQRLKNAQEAAQRVNAQQPQKKAEGPDYADYYRQQQRWNELLNKGKQS